MPAKRDKFAGFDANKSDSNDDDFDPTAAVVRKTPKKPRGRKAQKSKKRGGAKRRTKYKGSDISEDDEGDDDSLLEEISGDSSSSEDADVNPITGRPARKITKQKSVNYDEESESASEVLNSTDEEVVPKKPARGSRAVIKDSDSEVDEPTPEATQGPRLIVKLKLPTSSMTRAGNPGRNTRAGSAARNTRAGSATRTRGSVEPVPTMARRSTRARTAEGEEFTALSNSGKHVIRGSRSPEIIGRARATRGSKGVKQPASTIKEEEHETSSFEQDDQGRATMTSVKTTVRTEVVGTEEADDDIHEQHTADDADADALADELGLDNAVHPPAEVIDIDDEDDEVVAPATRTRSRGAQKTTARSNSQEEPEAEPEAAPAAGRRSLRSRAKRDKNNDDGSDFTPEGEEASEAENVSGSDSSRKRRRGDDEEDSDYSGPGPAKRGKATRGKSKGRSQRRAASSDESEDVDAEEVAEEAAELQKPKRGRARVQEAQIAYEDRARRATAGNVNYGMLTFEEQCAVDVQGVEDGNSTDAPARGGAKRAKKSWDRSLYTTFGPFGGADGPAAAIGGPWGTGAIGGVDSDSDDDDEIMQQPGAGGNVGMTPTSGKAPGLLPGLAQTNNTDAIAGMAGSPANLGKVKSQKALADADPLGVDQNVDFSKVGGLDGYIDQLKEMVQMPLLYPELFTKFHVTPPRGVLFHGPPGTGKTLMARALAASVGSGGRKITFFMRKGADALSKWVGEAERQLRLLFEEARKCQPSIIFFDEIDGLAPVRSSKQEQIHASIVSTLLALMDGMDGRGQVIVIGATNRPDNIDPALRRPGRFDREFYFPLPGTEARKSIINIHTEDWGIDEAFKDSLAELTKGYGGADLRALCTEAALNAIQRTYPQIYSSNEKLVVDPEKIKIHAKDFMISVKKIVPSSERSTSSGAAPLPKLIVPLLRDQLNEIERLIDELIPSKKKTTALQEAMYEQYEDDDFGFGRETLQQEFERAKVFRPRLLIAGKAGMGQAYLGGALLNHFEGLHVQSFDLPTIYSDSARSSEAAIVQLFTEAKRHKPSVIYLPSVETWYSTLPSSVIAMFVGLLKAIPATDPILLLGITEKPREDLPNELLRDLFPFSRRNCVEIRKIKEPQRREFFENIVSYVRKRPQDFPEPENRKKRKLEVLPVAPPPPPRIPTKEEIKALKKQDHQHLNHVQILIQPIMNEIHKKYRKLRNPIIPLSQIQYLLDEQDPAFVRPDVVQDRPYEMAVDKDGNQCLRRTRDGALFYNLDTTTIEERLANGFYARPKDFLADMRTFAKDAKLMGDKERHLKTRELMANVEVDIANVEAHPQMAGAEGVYQRQLQRAKEKEEKLKKQMESERQAQAAAQMGAADPGDGLIRSDVFTEGLGSRPQSPVGSNLNAALAARRQNVFQTPGGRSASFGSQQNLTNGSSLPSRISGEDVQMSGTNEHTQSTSSLQSPALPRQQWPSGMTRGAPTVSNRATGFSTQSSHRSALHLSSHNASPSVHAHDGSTTDSVNKTSEGWSTQATNGTRLGASSPVEDGRRDSDIPDTRRESQNQSTQNTGSSEEQWLHSQAHAIARGSLPGFPSQTPSSQNSSQNPPVPPFNAPARPSPLKASRPSGMADLLNDSPVEPTSSQQSSQKDFIIDEKMVQKLFEKLVSRTDGYTVEQMEQVNRELMVTLWKMRGEYNRALVTTELGNVFSDVALDIDEMQRVSQPSQSFSQSQEGSGLI